jgi:hypothetical protein
MLSGAVLLEPSSKWRRLLPREKKIHQGANLLSMAAMGAACAACCGSRLLMATSKRAAESHVSYFKKHTPPFSEFWLGLLFRKHTHFPNRQSMFSGLKKQKSKEPDQKSTSKTYPRKHTPENQKYDFYRRWS